MVGAQGNKSRLLNGGPTPVQTRLDGTGTHPRLSHDLRRSTNGKETQAEFGLRIIQFIIALRALLS